MGKRGYRIWDPRSGRVEISRDVVFDEDFILNKSVFRKMHLGKRTMRERLEEPRTGRC
jgi:hypothetical protein